MTYPAHPSHSDCMYFPFWYPLKSVSVSGSELFAGDTTRIQEISL